LKKGKIDFVLVFFSNWKRSLRMMMMMMTTKMKKQTAVVDYYTRLKETMMM